MRIRMLLVFAMLVGAASYGGLAIADGNIFSRQSSQPPLNILLALEEEPCNLLQNPGFELDFEYHEDPYSGAWAGELELGEYWDLWYDNIQQCPDHDPGCDPASYNRRPEYKREEGTFRVRSGTKSQKFFTTYGTHTAGFYQIVQVPAQSWVRFSIWVMAWSSQQDIAEHSFEPGYYGASVGIDPTGGQDWHSDNILWTEPHVQHDQWIQLEIATYTESGNISVWTRGSQIWPVKHNDSYWDDACLQSLSAAPTPTATPTQTATPYPTPMATPEGYEPQSCGQWEAVRHDTFTTLDASLWGTDMGDALVGIEDQALWLRNAAGDAATFSLAWTEIPPPALPWPERPDMQLALTFRYDQITGFGTTLGVGSEPYDGHRSLAGNPDPWGIDNILRIHQNSVGFTIDLLGETVWNGTPGDVAWHQIAVSVCDTTYVLELDGTEIARQESYWRPRSVYLGNPAILWFSGRWTEVAISELSLAYCGQLEYLQPVYKNFRWPTPTSTLVPTLPVEPTLPPDAELGPTQIPSQTPVPTLPLYRRPFRG